MEQETLQEPVFELKNFSSFDLKPVNLKLSKNETISISGESGSGKSLLLRSIADLIPHQGECFLNGVSANKILPPVWRTQVAYLASESQWWYETIGEHFKTPLSEQMQTFLQKIGFSIDVLDWQVMRCSTGERQRLSIIRMLANLPLVLLLDEPTANLDEENSMRVEELIKQYQHDSGASIFWVSHSSEQKKRVAGKQYEIQGHELIEVTK